MTSPAHIMVVDDEKLIRWSLQERLMRSQYQVTSAESGEEALAQLGTSSPDVMLLDVRLPGIDGLDVLKRALVLHPELVVVMMSAHGTVDIAVEGMKLGAIDFLVKPFPLTTLDAAVKRALGAAATRRMLLAPASKGDGAACGTGLVGESPAMAQLRGLVARISANDAVTVLIEGESGTGKEVVARCIHTGSARGQRPFLGINCAAVPETILESELFGHERGAFTDARAQKTGLFEAAAGGTVMLDEIGDMPAGGQAKLLRLLENRTFRRVGGVVELDSDVRVIAATNVDLEKRVADGRFRPDLYFRLNVVRIVIPPLRDHIEDVPLLAVAFINRYNEQLKRKVRGISPEALQLLSAYRWPGNVRELRNVIERAMVLYGEIDQVRPEHLPESICQNRPDFAPPAPARSDPPPEGGLPPESMELEAVERRLIQDAMQKSRGNQSLAARLLGVTRDTLRYRLKRHLIVERGTD